MISENDIYDFGLLSWPYTKGICIDGAGILVSHNDVHDSKTRAIYWSGAFQTIEYNDVHNVLTASDDIGAISTDDRIQAQNVIRYNYIHDIGAVGALANIKDFNPDYSYMGSAAVYGDFGGSYFEAYGNVICNVNGNGFQVGGRCISIHNNLIVNCSHWYVWDTAIQYSDYYREGKSGSSRHGYPDYIYSPAWKEANPDLASLIMDMAQTEHDDPRAWAAPVGNVIMNNWCHFNKADRYFSNWGVSPYSIEDVIYDFSDEIDVERGQRTNRNVSNYSGKREQPDLEELITVTAKGFVDMTWEQFQTIGRTGN